MDTFASLLNALEPINVFACFIGALMGTLVGVLPGLGATAAMALLLPLTYHMGPAAGIIMLAGIWYGAQYGGSTTSILVNIPGEASSVITSIDGHKMAVKGRAGAALSISAIGSFIAGTVSIFLVQYFAPLLANVALAFGPREFFAIIFFGVLVLSRLSGSSYLKSIIMVITGIIISTVGLDPVTGIPRFTFGSENLLNGIGFVPLVMGLFGVTEVISLNYNAEPTKLLKVKLRDLYPNRCELNRSIKPMFRGSVLGFLIGLMPGPAAVIATYASYGLERRISKHREEFGDGAVEGVAGPEAANNAAVSGGLVPLLALGIPFSPPAAILLGGMMIHNISPGPLLISDHPEIFWAVIGSMYLGNVMLLILNLPLVPIFSNISKISPKILMPTVLVICVVGAYAENRNIADVWVMLFMGGCGFFLRKLDFEMAPLILGAVLGTVFETNFRHALTITAGSFTEFLRSPIAFTFLIVSAAIITIPVILNIIKILRQKLLAEKSAS